MGGQGRSRVRDAASRECVKKQRLEEVDAASAPGHLLSKPYVPNRRSRSNSSVSRVPVASIIKSKLSSKRRHVTTASRSSRPIFNGNSLFSRRHFPRLRWSVLLQCRSQACDLLRPCHGVREERHDLAGPQEHDLALHSTHLPNHLPNPFIAEMDRSMDRRCADGLPRHIHRVTPVPTRSTLLLREPRPHPWRCTTQTKPIPLLSRASSDSAASARRRAMRELAQSPPPPLSPPLPSHNSPPPSLSSLHIAR